MKKTFRYVSEISGFPANIPAELILCVVFIGMSSAKFLHPLWALLAAFFFNIDSAALHGENHLLTYSLPFSRADLWNSRGIITFTMYLIPISACMIFDGTDAVLVCAEEFILLAGLFCAASCLRSPWWILAGVSVDIVVYIMYMIAQSTVLSGDTKLEDVSGGRGVIILLLYGMFFAMTLFWWRQERQRFTKGDPS